MLRPAFFSFVGCVFHLFLVRFTLFLVRFTLFLVPLILPWMLFYLFPIPLGIFSRALFENDREILGIGIAAQLSYLLDWNAAVLQQFSGYTHTLLRHIGIEPAVHRFLKQGADIARRPGKLFCHRV